MIRISHVCLQCGRDLARVRAVPEARYGLPVVVCPDCGWACVRRPHPFQRWWRTARRLDLALTVLVLQVVAVAVLLPGMVSGAAGLAYLADGHWGDADMVQARWFVVAGAGVATPLVIGAWLTAGFRHWRPLAVWSNWMVLFADYERAHWHDGVATFSEYLALRDRVREQVVDPWLLSLGAMAAMLPITAAGIPGGFGLLAGIRGYRRWRLRRRRRRRRLRLPVFP